MTLAALLLLLLAAPAFAKGHHRHHAAPVAQSSGLWSIFQGGGSDVVSAARSQLGNGAVYGRSNLWCARFMNYVLARTGHKGTGSDMASSFASMPHTGMHVGAIAVMSRHGGGHVGVVSGFDASGNPIIISGNNMGRVREAAYPAGRIYAFVVPQ
jgi:uncharacterized protein (TIGR02594 family)